ncbi:putative glycosyl hydrolase family 76 protein [Elsinoe australis]|uniref:Putative glycosyl hydrolase family 76 protein n=1 Tax=Elsinoe australis TaxID=40998 RepID=A0A4V6DU66_9PEZI|nr:putative glycosyl hydrolase family 76 protein [Elsinoe australis]
MKVSTFLFFAAVGTLTVTNAESTTSLRNIERHVYENAGLPDQAVLAHPSQDAVTWSSSQDGLLNDIQDALKVMQDTWFKLWIGTWPTAIDWTAAVINTYVTSALMTLSKHMYGSQSISVTESTALQGQIDKYFAHNAAFYFGENAFALRNQAYDDMLWVVLGWLQSVKFIDSHSSSSQSSKAQSPWHGTQFIPVLSHRARIFYDLAAKGWDTRLCGGGMLWNPSLAPYKNAITNQLFISASIGMYLYFPGDTNQSPYLNSRPTPSDDPTLDLPSAQPHSPIYLTTAIRAYAWLEASNMTNAYGLYVDGYHITDWSWRNRTGTGKCDDRNEMVYTYNQGVVLSGLRGLWESTANLSYLTDGHALVRSVIAATGYSPASGPGGHNPHWSGLGRNGVLEDYCDARGSCNQDGQTFKGIFFQHLTQFCQPLPRVPRVPGKTHGADEETERLHLQSCRGYAEWVRRNAEAALETRDEQGRFGMWWGAALLEREQDEAAVADLPIGAVDYRNRKGLTKDEVWTGMPVGQGKGWEDWDSRSQEDEEEMEGGRWDWNDRGRGRTVETQGGGLAVLRAAWELGRF